MWLNCTLCLSGLVLIFCKVNRVVEYPLGSMLNSVLSLPCKNSLHSLALHRSFIIWYYVDIVNMCFVCKIYNLHKYKLNKDTRLMSVYIPFVLSSNSDTSCNFLSTPIYTTKRAMYTRKRAQQNMCWCTTTQQNVCKLKFQITIYKFHIILFRYLYLSIMTNYGRIINALQHYI